MTTENSEILAILFKKVKVISEIKTREHDIPSRPDAMTGEELSDEFFHPGLGERQGKVR